MGFMDSVYHFFSAMYRPKCEIKFKYVNSWCYCARISQSGIIFLYYFGTVFIARMSYDKGTNSLGGISMKRKKFISGGVTLFGLVLTALTRSGAIAEDATSATVMLFALSLILLIVGFVSLLCSYAPRRQTADTRTLTMAAMFAALCYIGFAYLRIDIPVGTEKTAFHLGNVFCVLAALFLGGLWGGMSGAVGLTIADLTSGYVTSAPKTFLLKLGIGLIAGLVAHRVFHLSETNKTRKVSTPLATGLSCTAGMAFNVVADPTVGYFYKTYILGVPQDAAKIWVKIGSITTLVNAVIAVIVATVLYLALRPALQRSNLMPNIE